MAPGMQPSFKFTGGVPCFFSVCGRRSLPPGTPSPTTVAASPASALLSSSQWGGAPARSSRVSGAQQLPSHPHLIPPGVVLEGTPSAATAIATRTPQIRTAPSSCVNSPAPTLLLASPVGAFANAGAEVAGEFLPGRPPWSAPPLGPRRVMYFSDAYFPSGQGRPRRPMPPPLTLGAVGGQVRAHAGGR